MTMTRIRNDMRKQFLALLAGLAFSLLCGGNALATTATITVGTQSGTATYGTASSSITFPITVSGGGGGTTASGTYTVSGLPTGASGSFSPTTYSGVGNGGTASSTLTITTSATTPAVASQSFTVSASPST